MTEREDRRGSVRLADAMASGALAIVLAAALLVTEHPASHPPVVAVALDGFSWPVLSPSLARGEAPFLAELARSCRGRLVSDPGGQGQTYWGSVSQLRPSGLLGLPPLDLWDLLDRRGVPVALVDWPASPVTRLLPRGPVDLAEPVPEPPLPAGVDPLLALILTRDRGTVTRALQAVSLRQPRLLLIGLAGPFGASPGGGGEEPPLPAPSLRALDGQLRRLSVGIGDGATLVILGRGLGPVANPAGEGIFLGRGPALTRGPLEAAVRTSEIAPTLAHVLGCPLPIGTGTEPAWAALDPVWIASHPLVWEKAR